MNSKSWWNKGLKWRSVSLVLVITIQEFKSYFRPLRAPYLLGPNCGLRILPPVDRATHISVWEVVWILPFFMMLLCLRKGLKNVFLGLSSCQGGVSPIEDLVLKIVFFVLPSSKTITFLLRHDTFINLLLINHISYKKFFIVWHWWWDDRFTVLVNYIFNPWQRSTTREEEEYSLIHWSIHLGWSANLSKTLPSTQNRLPGRRHDKTDWSTLRIWYLALEYWSLSVFVVSNCQCLIVFLSTEKNSLAGDKKGGNFIIGRLHLYPLLVDLLKGCFQTRTS